MFPLPEVDEDDEEPVLFESEQIWFSKNPDGHHVIASLDGSIALRFVPLVVVEDGSDVGRFVNQDPILLLGGSNLYSFASNTNTRFDPLGLKKKRNKKPRRIIPYDDIIDDVDKWSLVPVSQRQKWLIKDKLSSAKQRSVQQNRMMRRDFSRREKSLIREWERETEHTWPAGATPHYIISHKNSGSNTWWNLTPMKCSHTGAIHGAGSALRIHLPYSTLNRNN